MSVVVLRNAQHRYWVADHPRARRVLARLTDDEAASMQTALGHIGWTLAPATPLDVATLRAEAIWQASGRTVTPRFEAVA